MKPSERKSWAREAFQGVENLLLPSFDPDLVELDEGGIRHDVRQSIAHGFFSTLVSPEGGLVPDLTKRLIEVVADEAGSRLLVGLSLHRDSREETIELAEFAASAGCSHAVLRFPIEFEPATEDDVYDFVASVASASSMGIVLPVSEQLGLTRFHISGTPFELYDRLADIDNVIGLRLDSIEPGLMYECFDRYGDRLLVTSSNFLMLPLLIELYGVQWTGGWTPEALQSPEQRFAVECFDRLRRGDTDQGMQEYWRLVPAYRVMSASMAPLDAWDVIFTSLVKYYQWFVGGNGGVVRGPSLYQRHMDVARQAFREIGIEQAESDDAYFLGRGHARSRASA